jgi:hypothetical protein
MQVDEAQLGHSILAIRDSHRMCGPIWVLSIATAAGEATMRLIPKLFSFRRLSAIRGRRESLKGRNDLCPDRNHSQKLRKRGKCSGFDGNSADHGDLPDENKTRT